MEASGHGDVLDALMRPREGEGEVEGCRRTIVCISGESGLTTSLREGGTRSCQARRLTAVASTALVC